MATIDDTVGKLARVYDSQTDTWIPLVGSPVPHVHNVSSSPDVDITEPLIDNEILAYSTSASAFVNTDSPTFDVATIDTANIDVANIIQPSTTVKPLIIRSTAPQTAAVTAATASSGSVTYAITSAETIFTAGDLVTISGINPSSLDDVRATVGSVSSGSVVIFSGKQGTYVSGGTATRIHANLLEIQNSAGTPTSTIRSDGSVTGELTGGLVHIETQTVSAIAAVSFNDVFSADYDDYVIKVNSIIGSGTINFLFRFRAAGTDATAGNYGLNFIARSNAALNSGHSVNNTSWNMGQLVSTEKSSATFHITNPFKAETSGFISNTATPYANTVGLNLAFGAGGHNVSTSYDGFTFLVSSGTFSGKISVFGYKD